MYPQITRPQIFEFWGIFAKDILRSKMEKKKYKYIEGVDQGPWNVQTDRNGNILVISDDCTHDVTIDIRGDFDSHISKLRYAYFICDALNQKAKEIEKNLK